MSPDSIHKLTPSALGALHDLDAEMATEIVKKFLEKAGDDPVGFANLVTSGLLGVPGQTWCQHIRERVDRFLEFACEDGFERGTRSEALIKSWLAAARPTPEDMAYVLVSSNHVEVALQDYLIEAGADPHLPIIRDLNSNVSYGRESYSSTLIGMSTAESVSPQLERMLVQPADDLPVVWEKLLNNEDNKPPLTLLDFALSTRKSGAVKVILDARDIHSPKVAQCMTDSLTRVIENGKNSLALRLIGVGAEPKGGDWEPVVSFFEGRKPESTIPMILDDFATEANDANSLKWNGRPVIATAIERLAAHGMNINVTDDSGHGMVYMASHFGCMKVLESLLELGAEYRDVLARHDVDRPDFAGFADAEKGKHMLQAHAARDAMSAIVKQAKANLGERP